MRHVKKNHCVEGRGEKISGYKSGEKFKVLKGGGGLDKAMASKRAQGKRKGN